ncbi:MAG TPA: BldC family transcriptional regulator [Actinomycetota bacterium]|jgi:excisionase family DNA binding protein|nr:BldC family transcriptional regulator [Actinomycetota bacterium]
MATSPVQLLRIGEVAALFRVDSKTVGRWAKAGKLSCTRTLGGHRRFYDAEVRALLDSLTTPATASPLDRQQAS